MQHTKNVKELLFPVIDCGIFAGTPTELFKIGTGIQNPKTGELYSYSFKPHKKCKFITNEEALSVAQQIFNCHWLYAYYTATDRKNKYHFFSNLFQANTRIEVINSYTHLTLPKYNYCFQHEDITIWTNVPALLFQYDEFKLEKSQKMVSRFKETQEKASNIAPLSIGFINSNANHFIPRWIYDAIPTDVPNAWGQMLHIAKLCNTWSKSSFEPARDFCATIFNNLYIRSS